MKDHPMSIEVTAKIVCDHPSFCPEEIQIELTQTVSFHPSWDARRADRYLEADGWISTEDGNHYCPDHAAEFRDEEDEDCDHKDSIVPMGNGFHRCDNCGEKIFDE
jgi:hypothetical protein